VNAGGRRALIAAALAATASLAIPAFAGATSATVGSPLTTTFSQGAFGTSSSVANSLPIAPATAGAPSDGTLISWSIFGNNGPFTPQVISQTGNGYTAATAGPDQTPGPTFARHGPFPISAPVKKGDLFGVVVPSGSSMGIAGTPGTTSFTWQPPLATNGPPRNPSATVTPQEYAVGAVLRYCVVPKVKKLKLKKAKRRLREADCTVGKVRKSKKVRRKKRVVKQGVAPGTSISDTAPIDLKVSRKP
jgi:hypothetical protein